MTDKDVADQGPPAATGNRHRHSCRQPDFGDRPGQGVTKLKRSLQEFTIH